MLGRPTVKIKLSESGRQEIIKEIQQQRERKVADRLRVVLYKGAGQTNQAIAAMLQMSRTQVKKVLSRYGCGGMSALLCADHYQGSAPKLTESPYWATSPKQRKPRAETIKMAHIYNVSLQKSGFLT